MNKLKQTISFFHNSKTFNAESNHNKNENFRILKDLIDVKKSLNFFSKMNIINSLKNKGKINKRIPRNLPQKYRARMHILKSSRKIETIDQIPNQSWLRIKPIHIHKLKKRNNNAKNIKSVSTQFAECKYEILRSKNTKHKVNDISFSIGQNKSYEDYSN